MSTLYINDQMVQSDGNRRLIDLLREDLKITSVKEGCSTGACGTCVVIVNGQKRTSCKLSVDKLDGAKITTIEGLSDYEKDVFDYAFGSCGAVQCGFCIPGMVISAKALFLKTLTPTEEDIKKAIRGNICRCTGYVKIIEAIKLAAEMIKDNQAIPTSEFSGNIAQHYPRVNNRVKVLGTGQYVDDMIVDGMIYASALRSEYPRARVLKIDTSAAEQHPHCVKILRAEDVPFNKTGHIIQDWDVLIAEGDITRYMGDAIVLVASDTKEHLEEIKALVNVTYEPLTPVTDAVDAMRGAAPLIHQGGNILSRERLVFGNLREAKAKAAHIVTRKYFTPAQEHAYMEPECAIAVPEGDVIHMYTASQSVYDEQKEISRMLNVAPEKIHCHAMLIGGGFGGKEDMSVQHHAALMAHHTKRPVKILLSRDESFVVSVKKHSAEIEMTTGCDENGKLIFTQATIVTDTGAYASLGGPVLQRACTHAGGPYNYQIIDILGIACYTNNPPAGAFRGFGVPQSSFAIENNLNLLAEKVGISPWEIRYRNVVVPGDVLPNGQIVDSACALKETLESVKADYENSQYAGLSCAFKNSGIGVGLPDIGRCIVSVENGKLHVRTSAADIGQGSITLCLQVVCETTGLKPEQIVIEDPDTFRTPNSGTTTASRQSLFTGEAVRLAAQKFANDYKNSDLASLEGKEYFGEYSGITDPMGSPKPNPVSHVTYGYATQLAILGDDAKLKKVVAAYDIGRVINPKSAEGQVEGGIVMGIGWALTENYKLEAGHLKSSYATLGIPRSTDVPEIEVRFCQSNNLLDPAYGAKGVGEIAMIPTAGAIAGAYYSLDKKLRSIMPLVDTPYTKK